MLILSLLDGSPATLVRVNEIVPQYGRFSVAPATFFDSRAQNTSFERPVAVQGGSTSFTASRELRRHRRSPADDRRNRVLRARAPGDECRSAGGDQEE